MNKVPWISWNLIHFFYYICMNQYIKFLDKNKLEEIYNLHFNFKHLIFLIKWCEFLNKWRTFISILFDVFPATERRRPDIR